MVGVALHFVVILRRAGLACHAHHAVFELLFGRAPYGHAFKHGLEFLDAFRRNDVFVKDDGVEFFDGLVASADFGDELRFHHAAVVGDGVVEHQQLKRRDIDFITN